MILRYLSDPPRFKKNLFQSYNNDSSWSAQNYWPKYDLDRLAAKLSAYSSGDLRKYEYMTGEDLGYKTSAVEHAKFDYSPLGKVFNKRLAEDDQEEGPLKGVKKNWR